MGADPAAHYENALRSRLSRWGASIELLETFAYRLRFRITVEGDGDLDIDLAIDGRNRVTRVDIANSNSGIGQRLWTEMKGQLTPAQLEIAGRGEVGLEDFNLDGAPPSVRSTLATLVGAMPAIGASLLDVQPRIPDYFIRLLIAAEDEILQVDLVFKKSGEISGFRTQSRFSAHHVVEALRARI